MRDPQKSMPEEYYADINAIYTSSKVSYRDSNVAAQQGRMKEHVDISNKLFYK
jgi:hypothetical protein